MPTIPQQQYIIHWHDSFVDYIGSLLGVVARLMARQEATEADKRVLESLSLILNGQDAADVEWDLAAGVVKRSTLDRFSSRTYSDEPFGARVLEADGAYQDRKR